jgi:hypothetical protein
MKFALFNQLQMPKPWRENAEVLIYFPLQAHRFDSQAQLRLSNDQLIEQGIIIGGDSDSVCRGIERWKNAGVDTLLLMLGAGNTTHEQVMRGLDILGEQVIPKFK